MSGGFFSGPPCMCAKSMGCIMQSFISYFIQFVEKLAGAYIFVWLIFVLQICGCQLDS